MPVCDPVGDPVRVGDSVGLVVSERVWLGLCERLGVRDWLGDRVSDGVALRLCVPVIVGDAVVVTLGVGDELGVAIELGLSDPDCEGVEIPDGVKDAVGEGVRVSVGTTVSV